MSKHLFDEFMLSGDTLQVYKDSKLIFASNKDRLIPLLEYVMEFSPYHQMVTIFDKIMGNAAALLAVKAHCLEVYSPLGSELAVKTLENYGVKYHFTEITPCILQLNGKDMCPMEALSMDKEPEEFYKAIRALSIGQNIGDSDG